jgi:putative endonuclease
VSPAPAKRATGQAGEAAAERYLKRQGFKLLHRNLHLGRAGELDLVMEHGGVLVFVEVKARLAGETLGGFVNINDAKQRKLWELGQLYLQRHPATWRGVRFDAVEVEFADSQLSEHTIRHLPDAFRL